VHYAVTALEGNGVSSWCARSLPLPPERGI